jgi:phenylpropionate dioxygenase-like ring-hydroxylating dioxygenase large terminal subunit
MIKARCRLFSRCNVIPGSYGSGTSRLQGSAALVTEAGARIDTSTVFSFVAASHAAKQLPVGAESGPKVLNLRGGKTDMSILDKPQFKRPPLMLPALGVPYPMTRSDRVPARRYYDPEFYAAECELLWPRVWQMACFLAEIPNPGDYVTYEILDRSIIVVRADDMTVRAFHNSCRHRGVELVVDRGNAKSGFTCPFHGWCYGLDGSNTFLYQPDLFEESNRRIEDVALAPCRVETLGGSAFITLDDNAPPLQTCIEPYGAYQEMWKVDGLWPEWWLSCRMPVNWKLAMEAFMEGYHVMQTHPQLYTGTNRNVYRELGQARSEETLARDRAGKGELDSRSFIQSQIDNLRLLSVGMAGMTHEKDIRVAEGLVGLQLPNDVGEAAKVWTRALNQAVMAWNEAQGIDMPDLDHIMTSPLHTYVEFVFPHFFILPTFSSASAYRIRPLGPEECLFDLWSLTRYPPGQQPLAPPLPTPMAPDDPRWPPIPAQDYSNLPRQQRGLHAVGFEYMRLSDKVEGLISNYQRLIDGFLAGLPHEQLVPAMHQVTGAFDIETRDIGI